MDSAPIFSKKIITMESGVREKHSVDGIVSARNMTSEYEHEKRDLQHLNQNFSQYLDRVKQMEATNKHLESQLRNLRERWGFETVEIRKEKDKELDDLRVEIDRTEVSKFFPQIKIRSDQYSADIIKANMDFLRLLANDNLQKIKKLQFQKQMFHPELDEWNNRYNMLAAELERLKNSLDDYLQTLTNDRNELDLATFNRINLENAVQTLKDQYIFLQAVQEEEIRELQDLTISQYDNPNFYKVELQKAINDIRKDFDILSDAQKQQITSYYKSRIQEVEKHVKKEEKDYEEAKTRGNIEVMNITSLKDVLNTTGIERSALENENNHLLAQMKMFEQKLFELKTRRDDKENQMEMLLNELSEEIQSYRNKLQGASDNNVSLSFEINTYRRLLEIQEKHISGSDGISDYTPMEHSSYSSQRNQIGSRGSSNLTNTVLYGGNVNSAEEMFSRGMDSSAGIQYGVSGTTSIESSSPHPNMFGSYGNKNISDYSGSSTKINRICVKKQCNGNISIEEIDLNNRYIGIENMSGEEINIGGYALYQKDDENEIRYNFPPNVFVRPFGSLKIYSRSAGRFASAEDIVTDSILNWLSSMSINTTLFKPNGEQIAEFTSRAK